MCLLLAVWAGGALSGAASAVPAELIDAASRGDAWAQYELGYVYDKGRGVPQDYGQAFRWYAMSAGQGYADAEYSLGVLYYFGLGVRQDYNEALRLFRLAVQHGKKDGDFLLGLSGLPCDAP